MSYTVFNFFHISCAVVQHKRRSNGFLPVEVTINFLANRSAFKNLLRAIYFSALFPGWHRFPSHTLIRSSSSSKSVRMTKRHWSQFSSPRNITIFALADSTLAISLTLLITILWQFIHFALLSYTLQPWAHNLFRLFGVYREKNAWIKWKVQNIFDLIVKCRNTTWAGLDPQASSVTL